MALVPRIKNLEKCKFDFNVHRFFFVRHFFSDKFVVFADQGVYFLDVNFKNARRISSFDSAAVGSQNIEGVLIEGKHLVFWNAAHVWLIEVPETDEEQPLGARDFYRAEEEIREVFFGLKGRYLIVRDGPKVVALDIYNPGVSFPVFDLQSGRAQIFYDTPDDVLYVKDKIQPSAAPSLFRVELIPLVNEKEKIEAHS